MGYTNRSRDVMTVAEYNKCVDLFSDRLFRFILKKIKNEADAQDVVQNTFLKMWQNCEKVEFPKAKSYLFTVAYRDMIDGIRKMSKISQPETMPDRATSAAAPSDIKDLLNRGLQRLSDVQRSVVMLKDYEGYSYKEIGEIVNLSEAQVKVYIFRARKKLKEFLVSVDKII